MGFHDSAPFLYISTETVADMTIATLGNQHVVPVNPLEMESECSSTKDAGVWLV